MKRGKNHLGLNVDRKKAARTPYLKLGLVIACSFVFVMCGITAGCRFYYLSSDTYSHAVLGTFGDSFGAVNALFSGLAFVGVVVAIFMQRDELKLQREELRLTREELKLTRAELSGQKDQMVQQNTVLSKQAFEGTFFKMLDAFDSFRAQAQESLPGPKVSIVSGQRTFEALFNILYAYDGHKMSSAGLARVYEDFYGSNNSTLGPYFRLLYQLLTFVSESGSGNPKHYTDLVRARLSEHELALLAANSVSALGNPKMLYRVVQFRMLKHLNMKEFRTVKREIEVLEKPAVFSYLSNETPYDFSSGLTSK